MKAVDGTAVVWYVADNHPQESNIDQEQQYALEFMIVRYDLSKNGDGCLQHPELDACTVHNSLELGDT